MIVLERWKLAIPTGRNHRLVARNDGAMACEYYHPHFRGWRTCPHPGYCLLLFAPTKTPRATASAKSRPRTRRP